MTFTAEEIRRRKSSLAAAEAEVPIKRTQCYVHKFLEGQQEEDFAPNQDGKLAERKLDELTPGNGTETPQHQPRHSRVLTKRQLAEMIYGIRELAKKVGHVHTKMEVRNIFILVKAHDETLIVHTRELTEWLLQKNPQHVV